MALPDGSVTFLFSDVEGSTRLARALGDASWAELLAAHDRSIDRAVTEAGGTVIKHEGDGAFAAFADAAGAVAAAVAIARGVRALAEADPSAASGSTDRLRLRIGVHTGSGRLTEGGRDYVGVDVHYAARLAGAANGGQILVSETTAALVRDRLPDGAVLVGEGRRALRDFEEPRPLHRLVVADAADDGRPLRALDAPSNLPESVTTFIGRADELARVGELLAGARILTLTGPGGTGKTRLALRLAEAVRPTTSDGAWFVELAPVRDVALIPDTIAAALGLRLGPDRPLSEELADYLRARQLVLVLDNLEQLLPDAGPVISDLVRGAPGLRLVVTSREVLRIAGEQEYRVPPLAAVDAVALFVERARLVRPDFAVSDANAATVGEICRRLDGLPLAIELAAARIRMFGPPVILERLSRSLDLLAGGARDLPERQRTLRGAVAWSYDLLSEPERAIFRRLAVFSGGWTADAAEPVVAAPGAPGIDILEGLESLGDKSLIGIDQTDHGEPRFSRHAFVREYAIELLEASGERSACEARHAEVFLALAEAAGPEVLGDEAPAWMDRLDHEQHNLRAAIHWSLVAGRPETGLRIGASIWRWWQERARLREGLVAVTELLAHPNAAGDSVARVRGLEALGGLAYWSQDFATCRRAYEERLAIAERLGDRRLLADAHYDIGFVFMVERDPEALRREEDLALRLYEADGDMDGVVRVRQALAVADFLTGRVEEAIALERANLAEFRRQRSPYRVADSSTLLAAACAEIGDIASARTYLIEALEIAVERDSAASTVGGLGVAALVAARSGDPEGAARLAGATRALSRAKEIATAPLSVLHLPDPAELAREVLGAERTEVLLAEGESLGRDAAVALAMAVGRAASTRA